MACGCKERRAKMAKAFSAHARKLVEAMQRPSVKRQKKKSIGLGG